MIAFSVALYIHQDNGCYSNNCQTMSSVLLYYQQNVNIVAHVISILNNAHIKIGNDRSN